MGGQTNSVGCMGFSVGKFVLYGYKLHVTVYNEIRDGFLSSNEDPRYNGLDVLTRWRRVSFVVCPSSGVFTRWRRVSLLKN